MGGEGDGVGVRGGQQGIRALVLAAGKALSGEDRQIIRPL